MSIPARLLFFRTRSFSSHREEPAICQSFGYRTQMTLFFRNPLILMAFRTHDPLFPFLLAEMAIIEANNGSSVRETAQTPVLFTDSGSSVRTAAGGRQGDGARLDDRTMGKARWNIGGRTTGRQGEKDDEAAGRTAQFACRLL
ncbi:hypothetical protein ACF3MZ_17240 [Paenibacillaceae bacterium WGS1546]|uniref:hypothetical protein n=1 Tax=Cohnella sp. WGS1546 TaxID=3366810 RepID=UPI00372D2B8F